MTEQTVLNDNNLLSESDENKIEFIQRQTNYNYSIAKNKLVENKFDEISVIKEYLSDNNSVKSKPNKINSINQEIYNQIRIHLNQPNNASKYLHYK